MQIYALYTHNIRTLQKVINKVGYEGVEPPLAVLQTECLPISNEYPICGEKKCRSSISYDVSQFSRLIARPLAFSPFAENSVLETHPFTDELFSRQT